MQVSGPTIIVLAAGAGTRMRSDLPKVMHEVCGRPLLGHVLTTVYDLSPSRVVVVCGHGGDHVREYLAQTWPDTVTTEQREQKGTGHAVRVTLEQLAEQGKSVGDGPILVTAGDTPLLTASSLSHLLATHTSASAAVTVLSAILDDPTGYGRIVRGETGSVTANVEHKDATAEQQEIQEINSGVYAFDPEFLVSAITGLTADNSQGEQYLPDLIAVARKDGLTVEAVVADDAEEVSGVNNRAQLAACGAVLQRRINNNWLLAGVSMRDPATTYVDADVVLHPDVVLEPGVILRGATEIHPHAVIGPDSTLIDTEVHEGATVNRSHLQLAVVGKEATVGPFTFLRPGSDLGPGSKVGAYVEMKNAQLGADAKVPHLTYVGDAEIGPRTNIGAATIFANYDGEAKHHTDVGADVRIGSDTMLVAPVTVGDGAYTAAGSVITEDVPPGALAVARGRQHNAQGWVTKHRPGTESAQAAQAAADTENEGE